MSSSEPVTGSLSEHEFLIAEYGYIGQSAFQANEDRARVASFYFVSVGSLVAAILGSQFANGELSPLIYAAFSLLFTVLTVLGVLTVFQLARLRAAWYSSAMAMKEIKDHYIQAFPAMAKVIKWQKLPKKENWYSIANLLRIQVAMLATLTCGAALYTLFRSFLGQLSVIAWVATFSFPIGLYIFQRVFYFSLLKE